jgi:iron complex outermembrane recepter protein
MLKRVSVAVTLLAIACSMSLPAYAVSEPRQIDIPAGNLVPALETLQRQAQIELLYEPNQLRSFRTHGLRGTYEPHDAVRILLRGTPLELQVDQSGALSIVNTKTAFASGRAAQASFEPNDEKQNEEIATAPTSAPAPQEAAGGDAAQLQEVVVTAQKRAQNLIDVPVPVSVVNAQSLVSTGQLGLEDYYTQVPGLTVTPSVYGTTQVSIRGITTGGFTNPSVGITVDDVPYGSSSGLASGQEVTNLDPGDLQNIEVLRGPQGTLYGASSLGGLIKYVTIDPSLTAVSGQVQVGTDDVRNGGNLGYNLRGAVNVPLDDTLALYGSTFYRTDPGYIDDVLTGQTHVDKAWAEGGFLKGLWRPSEDVSLRVTALVQDSRSNGISEAYSGLGDLQQSAVWGSGVHSRQVQAYSATLTAKLGPVNLTAVSSYSLRRFAESYDYTSLFSTYTLAQFGVTGTPVLATGSTYRFTQEIRLNGSIGPKVEWLFGGYYDHQNSPANGGQFAVVPTTGEVIGQWVKWNYPSTYEEIAGFGDLTFHITNQFDLQLGGRESTNRQTYSEYDEGPYVPLFEDSPSPFVFPEVHYQDTDFTYLITPQFKLSPDSMIYARVATGYRPGGPNEQGSAILVPRSYNPDTTRNYEIGVKSEVLNHTLLLDASVYYIQWHDIQLQLINPINGLFYYANGSEAKSQGLELSAQAKPLTGLSITGWVAWNDARLTEPMPAASSVFGSSGDRLPYSEPFSGNLSLEQRFPLTALVRGAMGFVGGDVSYVPNRVGQFASVYLVPPERQDLPCYTKVDLRTGIDYDTWTVNLYVNNVADTRGVLDSGLDLIPTNAFIYIQPRTIGMTVSKTF